MPFDLHKNLAISTVAVAPSPPTSGTTLSVALGHGTRFPDAPFNVTIWQAGTLPEPPNAEVCRVTAKGGLGDTFTLVRMAEPGGNFPRVIVAGDLIAETITAKAFADIESGVNFPQIITGRIQGSAYAGTGGQIDFLTGPTDHIAGRMWPGGGFSWGNSPTLLVEDPGDTNISAGNYIFKGITGQIRAATQDGDDHSVLQIAGGGGTSPNSFSNADRGAYINLFGNEWPGIEFPGGGLTFGAGEGPNATIDFRTIDVSRGLIYRGGGFSWGTPPPADPGVSNLTVLGTLHADAGKRVLSVTGGFTGSVTDFLRGDGVFAPPGGGTVALHASTHVVGGSDPITGALSLTTLTTSGAITAIGDITCTNLQVNGSQYTAGTIQLGAANAFIWLGSTCLRVPADGRLTLLNNANTDFSLLQFGGTTNAFPALKRNAGGIDVVAADNSANRAIGAQAFVAYGGVINLVPAAIQALAGSPEGVAAWPVGSLYLRTDGGTGTTLYVKETGAATATGWRAMPAPGAPALHASTHVIGGSDVIPNVAWTNTANVFTEDQTISKVLPKLFLIQPGRPVDTRRWQLEGDSNGNLAFHPTTDAGALQSEPLLMFRNGDTTVSGVVTAGGLGTTPLNATQLTSGTVPDARLSVNVLKHTGGYPGDGSLFLNGMGSFVVPPSGGGAAHHLTHEVGGGDQITGPMAFSTLLVGGTTSLTTGVLRMNTADGADNLSLALSGGGNTGNTRGASIFLYGNEAGAPAGQLTLQVGVAASASINFNTAGATSGRMHQSGGFSWGSLTDPGAGNVGITGTLGVTTSVFNAIAVGSGSAPIRLAFNSGGKDAAFGLEGTPGGFGAVPAGAAVMYTSTSPGIALMAINAAGTIQFLTGGFVSRGRMHASGGFSWGSDTDPGVAGKLTAVTFAATGTGVAWDSANAGTGNTLMHFVNTGGNTYFGTENSASGSLGLPPYASCWYADTTAGLALAAVSGFGMIRFYTGGLTLRGQMHANGAFSWGSGQDPTVGTTGVTMSVAGNLAFEGAGEHYFGIRNTVGADSGVLTLCGGGPTPGGTATANRGGSISVNGINNVGNPGGINLQAANNAGALIKFQTNDQSRMIINYDGGVTIGATANQGNGQLAVQAAIVVGASIAAGTNYIFLGAGVGNASSAATTGAFGHWTFRAGGADVGSITSNGGVTAYSTTSDARLKTDLGIPLETRVLPALVVHDFQWKTGGTPHRGLFAQEAYEVLPQAVTPGCDGPVVDEVWQIDYSKVVPDLIVGWQQHEAELQLLRAELAKLKGES